MSLADLPIFYDGSMEWHRDVLFLFNSLDGCRMAAIPRCNNAGVLIMAQPYPGAEVAEAAFGH
jgi:hypothetical protein